MIKDLKDFVLALLWHIKDAIENRFGEESEEAEDEVADVWAAVLVN